MSSKKYQVFVSSTFLDLKNERQAVSRAILNLGHIPAGMELFPAADIDQLVFIKKVIDDCDYYLLIVGGKYGSISEDGLSFTELEYQYAIEKNKPVLAFLHQDISEIASKNVDSDPEKILKLESFRKTVSSGRLVEFWTTTENLEAKALVGLTNAFNEKPQIGWRRDTGELNAETQLRVDKMRERYDYTRDRLEETRKRAAISDGKLKQYESLEGSELELRFTSSDATPTSVVIGAEVIIREFAAMLPEGISNQQIEWGLLGLLTHKYDAGAREIARSSINNVGLFLEVFEIATRDASGLLTLRDDKAWLLKAAFKPLKQVISDHDDEIPF